MLSTNEQVSVYMCVGGLTLNHVDSIFISITSQCYAMRGRRSKINVSGEWVNCNHAKWKWLKVKIVESVRRFKKKPVRPYRCIQTLKKNILLWHSFNITEYVMGFKNCNKNGCSVLRHNKASHLRSKTTINSCAQATTRFDSHIWYHAKTKINFPFN